MLTSFIALLAGADRLHRHLVYARRAFPIFGILLRAVAAPALGLRTIPPSLLVALLLVLLTSPALAQNVSVSAQLSTSRAYVGDSVTLQLSVAGASEALAPDLSTLDGLRAEYVGSQRFSSQGISIGNGPRTQNSARSYIMQYRLTPTRAGTLTIPPIAVTVGGTSYSTQALTLTALEPGDSDDFSLKIGLDKPSAYVGEPVKLTLTWYLGKNARGPQLNGPDGGDEFDIFPGPDPRPPGTAQDDQRFTAINFLGGQVIARIGAGTMNGQRVTTVTVERIIIPRRAGSLVIGPYTVAFDAVTGQRAPTFFDSPFDDRSITERTVIASNTISLDVAELPTEGRPDNFENLVGVFGLAASAGATEASVGDPIALTLRITGPEPLDRVKPPDLERQAAFDDFKLSPEGWQPEKESPPGERTFTTTIRARHDRVTQVPPIALPYFDTVAGAYSIATSKALPLTVRASREVTTADAVGAVPAAPISAAQATITSLAPGIRANYEGTGVIRGDQTHILAMLREPAWLAIVVGPPVLCAGIAIARWRAPETPARRRARALAHACRSLRRGGEPARIAAALRGYVAVVAGIRPEAVTSADIRRLVPTAVPSGSVRGSSADTSASRTEAILFACERSGFASDGPPPNADEALGALRALDASLRGRTA
ncbi:MAG: BatD family protein [Phycisphaerales bacterium]